MSGPRVDRRRVLVWAAIAGGRVNADIGLRGDQGACPDMETMAAYLDNRLEVSERMRVEDHLIACERCYELVTESALVLDEVTESEMALTDIAKPEPMPAAVSTAPSPSAVDQAAVVPIRPRRTRWIAVGGGLLAAAAALLLVVRFSSTSGTPRAVDPALADLIAATSGERKVAARLTGGFPHAPLVVATRGPVTASPRVEELSLVAAAGRAQQLAKASPTSEHLHTLGIAYLLLGELDQAVQTLSAVSKATPSARSHSDLAAALSARAATGRYGEDLSSALEEVEAALRSDRQLPEALFNKALILEEFGLKSRARAAWSSFLEVDDRSPWADEARRHLADLSGQAQTPNTEILVDSLLKMDGSGLCALVERDGQWARETVEDELLPRWGEAFLNGDSAGADAHLSAARRLTTCLTASTSDSSGERAVTVIEGADSTGRAALASAYGQWRTGRLAFARGNPSEFGPAFAAAGDVFERYDSPMKYWARQYRVAASFYGRDLAGAEQITDAIVADLDDNGSPALVGRLRWNIAAIRFQQARFGEAVTAYREALSHFQTTNERDNTAAIHQSIAETLGAIGRLEEAWQAHRLALASVADVRDYRRQHAILIAPGYTAAGSGLPAVALAFYLEARDFAVQRAHINYEFEAVVGAGAALLRLGMLDDADGFLSRAKHLLPSVSNPSLQTRLGADLDIAFAELAERRADLDLTLRLTDQALKGVNAAASEYRLASLYLMRGSVLARLGSFDAARQELRRGIEHLESRRLFLASPRDRISYVDRVWDLYGDMTTLLALDMQDPIEALTWAERGRSQSFNDGLASIPAATDWDRAAHTLPPTDAVLFLALSSRGLLAWLMTSTGVRFEHTADATALSELAALGSAASRESLAAGWDVVLRPFAPDLAGITHLTLVPDWQTQTVAFAALYDRAANTYLVQRSDLVVAPSLRAAFRGRPSRSGPPNRVAVFVNAGGGASGYPALRGAVSEAAAVAQLYSHVTVYRDAEATFAALNAALRSSDVVHLAMHATNDGRFWQGTTLHLTGEPRMLDLEPARGAAVSARIVVLAACSTARGPIARGETLLGFARPFLGAGAESVVVTLSDVADGATANLMMEFHRNLAVGSTAAEALARAQRAAIDARFDPNDHWWSAFVTVGRA